MLRFLQTAFAGVALGAGLLMAGCHSHEQTPTTYEMSIDEFSCDKCQITWVGYPIVGDDMNRQIVVYGTPEEMKCHDCKDAVANYFTTSQFKQECPGCGGNMAHLRCKLTSPDNIELTPAAHASPVLPAAAKHREIP